MTDIRGLLTERPAGREFLQFAAHSWAEAENVSHGGGASVSGSAAAAQPPIRCLRAKMYLLPLPRPALVQSLAGEGEGRHHLPGVWVSIHQGWTSQRQRPGTGKHFNETEKKKKKA